MCAWVAPPVCVTDDEGLKNCSLPSDEVFRSLCNYCGIDPHTTSTKELAVIAFLYIFVSLLGPDQLVPLALTD